MITGSRLIASGLLVVAVGVASTPTSLGLPCLGSAADYTLLQLGGPEEGAPPPVGGELLVASESTVYGSIGMALESGMMVKISSSTVDGDIDRELGVDLDVSSSTIGGDIDELSDAYFDAIVDDALAASLAAFGLAGAVDQVISLGTGESLVLNGSGGANVFSITDDFILDGATLELAGGADDFFVFNVDEEFEFKINSGAEILLTGLDPSQVLFNIGGYVGGGYQDDVHIQESLFSGTLLATGRNVLINDNEYAEGHGLYGSVIAGGTLNFQESDITHDPFSVCRVPDPGTTVVLLLLGTLSLALTGARRRVSF